MTVIEVDGLHKRYGERVAVDDVSFDVAAGEIFGILGPNGAGKTTTVECVEGLRRPDRGTVRVLGLDPRADAAKLRPRVGVQLQESRLPDRLKVWEALDLYSSFYPRPVDWRALLDDWGLADRRDAPFGKLSGGQKQRLFVALALIGDPEIVLLDELTTGLDPQARRDTWELVERIRDAGVTVVLVTHFMEEAERLCDRLMVVGAGRVVAVDTPEGLIARAALAPRVRFRCVRPFDERLLRDLPEVTAVRVRGSHVEVAGGGDLLHAVTSALAGNQVTVADLRTEQPTLDDAYVALVGGRENVS
ncbi:multidrug ABC transporter ATP-binding protein [Microtetraspora sp. NBRC 13810]|uniref:ABC transporter ATP-binding protein n=1 Tax=Microtetraspora sp. NBRC 13810 TaxID=3030990 RepID=UPI0024A00770|nr:ABC transporter ATP-binding protein [Microtetraspora sp. NBRC 13810]GLW06108.1 multidrug ABC transporter ATP-binding protein [Microtetraspora sp. NBRC 13810]